jgi:outer membrane receptor protein involved in Fe transport
LFLEETDMKQFTLAPLALVCALSCTPLLNLHAAELEEVVVTAELIEQSVLELPNSVTVIDNKTIERRGANNLEDLLNLAPNVNFSSGASRGRFIQIRGIGERSEFQEPIINSVGVVVDGIDLTGIATAASTLDIDQVEVLRGPQGTLFGANALAGLINVVSNKPTDAFYGRVTAALEDYDGREASAVISGPTSENSGYRLAVKHYESNGFTEDVFLDRDDTNNIDETTARARFITQVNDTLNLDFTVFLADIDNGYDAFSLDNTRQTYSDQPGYDRQETTAASVKSTYTINDSLSIEGLVSVAKSDLEYAFDEDWSHLNICENTACDSDLFGFDWFYSSFDNYTRENDNTSIDLRLVSAMDSGSSWVVGLYHRDQSVSLDRVYTFADADFTSLFDTKNTALYGQVDFTLSDQWSLTTGLRLEQRDVDYTDNTGEAVSPDEDLWGGRVALEYQADSGAFYYGLVSRGYKPGGFNLDGNVSAQERQFKTETMLNYELGFKQVYFDNSLQIQVSAFYQDRNDIQTKQSIVRSIATGELSGPCPCSFTDFTGNADGGTNSGIELEANWQASERLSLNLALGLLDTEFDTLLAFDHVNSDRENGVAFDLKGREQAHAPSYQTVIGGAYELTPALTFSGSIEAKDDFFFSDRHEERSDAYELVNLELTYAVDNWSVAVYGKNITDELVKTRGFGSFGNDPRKFYETEPYNQFGAPRVVGVRGSLEF